MHSKHEVKEFIAGLKDLDIFIDMVHEYRAIALVMPDHFDPLIDKLLVKHIKALHMLKELV